jgi:bifunctional oligoribonuclease and PAP phosphatase NrnA
MKNLAELKHLLASPKHVVIVTHFKPDADALGSSLGLAGYLKQLHHHVTVITPSDYPAFLHWMPGHETVVAVNKNSAASIAQAEMLLAKADIIFCLDFSSLNRIDVLEQPVRKANAVKVMIDHHLEPENFAEFELWNVASASTAGLIYEFIAASGGTDMINPAMANCLYAGLMTDTGGFRHNNTRYEEFQIASDLVRKGANPHDVAKNIYDTNSLERLRLTGFVLSEKLRVLPEYKTAYMTLTADELKRFGSQTGDTEGLVNYGLSIHGIRLSVFIYDRGEEIKLSLRSLGSFSVNEMARAHFEGGGHRNASGGKSNLTLEKTIEKFLSILPAYKHKLLTE